MSDDIEAFFVALPARGRAMLPPRVRGTLRVDLVTHGSTDHWYVDLRAADQVVVNRDVRAADAVLTTTPAVFVRLVRGESPATAVLLRNEATLVGDARLILAFRRYFPPPRGTGDPREGAQRRALHGQAWRERLRAGLV
ncbi:SCP2 sterol-binding domain-containing protein [Micromonospora sp. NPDC005707]|uniref:SCP2 sterol-binding domain-containing protein n=1 Tax=Micromonospora sp. NPDC005707 TaxID=3157050 RepID=UPI0033E706C7